MFAVRSELCIGCGICAKVCPANAISIRAGKSQINQSACIECGRCAQACPRGAIKEYILFSHAVGVPPRPFVPSRASLFQLRASLLRLQRDVQILNERLIG
jgi:Fe-S-cluster-containing hydrogenase component 2